MGIIMSLKVNYVGIEIDNSIIRASILDSEVTKIIGYAELKRSNEDENFDNLSKELAVLWKKLPEKFTSCVKVAATFGVNESGVQKLDDPNLSIESTLGENFCGYVDNELTVYAPKKIVETILGAFNVSQIPLERLELAVSAAARTLPSKSDCTFTVGSGCWWFAEVEKGRLTSASQKDVSSNDRSLYLVESAEVGETQLNELSDIAINSQLVDTFKIAKANLAVSAGAAKGIIEQSTNFVPEKIAEKQTDNKLAGSESTESEVIDFESLRGIDPEVDSAALNPTISMVQQGQLQQSQAQVIEPRIQTIESPIGTLPSPTQHNRGFDGDANHHEKLQPQIIAPLTKVNTSTKVENINDNETETHPVQKKSKRSFWKILGQLVLKLIIFILLACIGLLAGLGAYFIINETDLIQQNSAEETVEADT